MEKPSLAEVMADPEFCAMLEADGMPTLFSRWPAWPWDEQRLRALTSPVPDGAAIRAFVAGSAVLQRQKDASHKHLCLLVKRAGDTVRPASEWSARLLEPTGCSVPAEARPRGLTTANDFAMAIRPTMRHGSGRDCPEEAKVCDHCGAITTCLCACGEAFCSRECMGKAWGEHAGICWIVFDNGRLGDLVNRMEYEPHERGPAKPPARNKVACRTCGTKGAKRKCVRCDAPYCSKYCQVLDWKQRNHKAVCVQAAAASS